MMSDRRTFLKKAGTGCIALTGMGGLIGLLSSCGGLSMIKADVVDKKITVPLSSFSPEDRTKIVRSNQLNFDILLVREPGDAFHALQMKCTHFDNNLVANAKGLACSLHGSTFDLDGNVTNGPAINPLPRYLVTTDTQNIIISVA